MTFSIASTDFFVCPKSNSDIDILEGMTARDSAVAAVIKSNILTMFQFGRKHQVVIAVRCYKAYDAR